MYLSGMGENYESIIRIIVGLCWYLLKEASFHTIPIASNKKSFSVF